MPEPRRNHDRPVVRPSAAGRRRALRLLLDPQPHRSHATCRSGPSAPSASRPILLDRPIKATAATFDKTLHGTDVPVLVDFYADWCGPCHMMAPTLDDFARRHVGAAAGPRSWTPMPIQRIAGRYGIRGIPTLIVFDRGQERGRHVGVADLKTLEALVGV